MGKPVSSFGIIIHCTLVKHLRSKHWTVKFSPRFRLYLFETAYETVIKFTRECAVVFCVVCTDPDSFRCDACHDFFEFRDPPHFTGFVKADVSDHNVSTQNQ